MEQPSKDSPTCSCAAEEYARRWVSNAQLAWLPRSADEYDTYRRLAFEAGYHVAMHLIRIALHDMPDSAGNINVCEPDPSVNLSDSIGSCDRTVPRKVTQ